VRTPVHVVDVVQSDRLGVGGVDGELEGGMEGVDDGIVVGAGDVDGVDDGADDVVGRKEVEGFDDGVDDHDDVKGSQMGFALSLLDPVMCVLKYTPKEKAM